MVIKINIVHRVMTEAGGFAGDGGRHRVTSEA
jgi:hypothetical protein